MSGSARFTGADVTVVMPVRDREQYVAESIESLLTQTAPPGRIIVVDDGSQDRTPEILEGFGTAIHVLRQEPSGQYSAMNLGIEATETELLTFLDSDDLLTPNSLEVRLTHLAADDAPEAVIGRTLQFISPELSREEAARLRFDPTPQAGEILQAMVIRTEAFLEVGLLDASRSTGANIDWVARSRAAGLQMTRIDDIVCRRRLHRTNIGITAGETKRTNLLAVLRAHRHRSLTDDGSSEP